MYTKLVQGFSFCPVYNKVDDMITHFSLRLIFFLWRLLDIYVTM